MATWTTTFSAKSEYTLTLTLTEKSYNIATNKSTVEYTLTMACSGYVGFSDYRVQASLTVGGVSKLNYDASRAFNVPVKASYSEVLATGTMDITHNADGTGSCAAAAYVLVAGGGDGISPGRAPSSGTLGGTLTLTTIPRASTATVPSAYTIGAAGSAISIATASSAFTHRLKFSTGTQSQTVNIAAGTTSYTWTPAAATWGPQFPTQTSRSVTVLLETLSGGTVIGSNTYTTTLSIPASWKPTVSASLSQYSTNSFMSGKAFYVAGYSAIRAAITGALGDSYTTIKSYTISGAWSKTVTTTASSTTQTSGVIASSGTKTTTITITDARGRTGTWSGNVSFLSYAVPAITTLTYARGTYSGGVWTSSASGTDLRIQFKATCSLSGNGNDMDWTIGAPVSASGTSLASGTQIERFKTGIGTTTRYTVAVTVKDDIGNTVSRSITVPTVEIPLTIDPVLPGVGVGAIPQTARTLELASDWYLNPGAGIAMDSTNDVLASAMAQSTLVKFYRGNGASYTGTLPHANFAYGTFIVLRRASSQIMVLAISQSSNNGTAMNSSVDGSTWVGWRWWGNSGSSLGTNSNYTKLSDGTMIQWGTTDLTSMALTQIASSGVYTGTKALTFPAAFLDQNYIVTGRSRYSTGHSVPIGFNTVSTTQAQVVVYDFYARSGTITVKWQAVGRWK